MSRAYLIYERQHGWCITSADPRFCSKNRPRVCWLFPV